MTTMATSPISQRSTLLRFVVLGGLLIFLGQTIHQWVALTLIQKTPFMIVWQYIASGVLGDAAFAGGLATAWLGLFFHLIISTLIAAVFFLGIERLPLLRRYAIPGALLYGLIVFVVMNMVVTPLSATPPLPAPPLPWLIEYMVDHIVVIGLSLGLTGRRYAGGGV